MLERLRAFRRQREWQDLQDDPRTPYMVGRLLGANEMAVALLSRDEVPAEEAQRIAGVLARVLGYFMEEYVDPVSGALPP